MQSVHQPEVEEFEVPNGRNKNRRSAAGSQGEKRKGFERWRTCEDVAGVPVSSKPK